MRHPLVTTLLAGLALGILAATAPAQQNDRRTGLNREALAGQSVPVLPLTHLARSGSFQDSTFPADRESALAVTDSLLGEALIERAPEVTWVAGAELRRVARRSAGILPEPTRYGQAVLRSPNLKTVPDPTRAHLRTLAALANGRYVFVPASVLLERDEEGAVRATLVAVLADTRTGRIMWRADAIGAGATAAAAIRSTIDYFLPDLTRAP